MSTLIKISIADRGEEFYYSSLLMWSQNTRKDCKVTAEEEIQIKHIYDGTDNCPLYYTAVILQVMVSLLFIGLVLTLFVPINHLNPERWDTGLKLLEFSLQRTAQLDP